jgi:hypothetical protein
MLRFSDYLLTVFMCVQGTVLVRILKPSAVTWTLSATYLVLFVTCVGGCICNYKCTQIVNRFECVNKGCF